MSFWQCNSLERYCQTTKYKAMTVYISMHCFSLFPFLFPILFSADGLLMAEVHIYLSIGLSVQGQSARLLNLFIGAF